MVEITAVLIKGCFETDKKAIASLIEQGYMPKLVRREVFKFMAEMDLWTYYNNFSETPALYTLTDEQWKEAHRLDIAHG